MICSKCTNQLRTRSSNQHSTPMSQGLDERLRTYEQLEYELDLAVMSEKDPEKVSPLQHSTDHSLCNPRAIESLVAAGANNPLTQSYVRRAQGDDDSGISGISDVIGAIAPGTINSQVLYLQQHVSAPLFSASKVGSQQDEKRLWDHTIASSVKYVYPPPPTPTPRTRSFTRKLFSCRGE